MMHLVDVAVFVATFALVSLVGVATSRRRRPPSAETSQTELLVGSKYAFKRHTDAKFYIAASQRFRWHFRYVQPFFQPFRFLVCLQR